MLFKSGMAVGLDVYLRLGNSASQVESGSTVDYVKLLGMVTQLQQHLLKAEAETSSEPKPDSACWKPEQPEASEAEPVAAKPAEAKCAEAKPVKAKPAQAKPAEAKPAEAKPTEAWDSWEGWWQDCDGTWYPCEDRQPSEAWSDDEPATESDAESLADAEQVLRVQEAVKQKRGSDASKGKAAGPIRPVATPVRAAGPSCDEAEASGPDEEDALSAAAIAPAPAAPAIPTVINSTTHKKEYMRLEP